MVDSTASIDFLRYLLFMTNKKLIVINTFNHESFMKLQTDIKSNSINMCNKSIAEGGLCD